MTEKKRDPSGLEAKQPVTGNGSGPRKSSKRRRTTVPHEELVPGTELTATLKGQTFAASVVLGEEGKPEVEFEGVRYPSPSAAGKAAAGYPVNGWRFWRPVEQPQE
jgi:hypothetical protein